MTIYRFISIGLMILFFVLLFSNFATGSAYHGILAMSLIFVAALIESKLHYNKRPDLIKQKKFTYGFLIIIWIAITISLVMPEFTSMTTPFDFLTKPVMIILYSILIMIVLGKLVLRWRKLNNTWRILCIFVIFIFILAILTQLFLK